MDVHLLDRPGGRNAGYRILVLKEIACPVEASIKTLVTKDDISNLRDDIKSELADLRYDLADLRQDIRNWSGDIIRWMFFFSMAYVIVFLLTILFVANK